MSAFIINGGKKLYGSVTAQGSKNSAVAVLIASLVTKGVSVIDRVPEISDCEDCITILRALGCVVKREGERVYIDTTNAQNGELPVSALKRMRASSYLIGAMLSRFGECNIPDSGGCNFGTRPINYHIDAMCALGAELDEGESLFRLNSPKGLKGTEISLEYPSVGATVNSVIAASRSCGVTVIKNAAKEPHISDLCRYLSLCGAEIYGAGTERVTVCGKKELHGAEFELSADMIESGTYLIYGLMTEGFVTVEKTDKKQLSALCMALKSAGAKIKKGGDFISVCGRIGKSEITTAPYPGFPTDLQPQFAALLGRFDGGFINETVFSGRFGYTHSLFPFGFSAIRKEHSLYIVGAQKYHSAETTVTDLRGGAAAVGAALSADGISTVKNAELILRGYSCFAKKLSSLGANINFRI